MENINFEEITRKYVQKRFPLASSGENEKVIQDWLRKVKNSEGLTQDIEKKIGHLHDKKVLDAGSGNGGISIALSLKGALAFGVDIEPELIEISKIHLQKYNFSVPPTFLLYNGDKLPFDDSTFDLAVSISVLEHTDDPINYLSEISRTLKPGGMIYLAFPNKIWPKETHTGVWFLSYLPRVLANLILKILRRNPLEENNLHFYTYWKLLSILQSNQYLLQLKIMDDEGSSRNYFKKILKKTLKLLGISYKAFLPHIMVVLKKNE